LIVTVRKGIPCVGSKSESSIQRDESRGRSEVKKSIGEGEIRFVRSIFGTPLEGNIMMKFQKMALLIVPMIVSLTACLTPTPTPTPNPNPNPVTTGTLSINISGPTDATFTPNVQVTDAGGTTKTINSFGNQTLTLQAGDATIKVNDVVKTGTIIDTTYVGYNNISGNPKQTTTSIATGGTAYSSITYLGSGLTGNIWLSSRSTSIAGYKDGPLAGSNSGDTLSGGSLGTSPATVAGFGYTGMAFDRSGNVWIANYVPGLIEEYNPNGKKIQTITPVDLITAASPFGRSLGGPQGLAFDPNGDLWVSNYSYGSIVKYNSGNLNNNVGTPGSPTSNALVPNKYIEVAGAGPQNDLRNIAFDSTGNLWVTNSVSTKKVVYKYDAATLNNNPAPSVTLGGFTSPFGIAFDSSGRLWIADGTKIKRFNTPPTQTSANPPTDAELSNQAVAFDGVNALAFDKSGGLWALDKNGIQYFATASTLNGNASLTSKLLKIAGDTAQSIALYPVPTNLPIYK
jgi:streptogramin lyase